MPGIKFHKMVASGNDFVIVDNRDDIVKNPKAFAAEICKPHVGIGADGVLFIEKSNEADFFMRIINADGSEAEACGNGYRCIGLYANKHLNIPNPKFVRVGTAGGPIEINVESPQAIKVKMIEPTEYRERVDIKLASTSLQGAFINTGVPHVVIFAENLDQISVIELGREIRHHKMFAPRGTNVNFVQITGKNSLSIRTYERGVEGETLACGTGTAAAAIVASFMGRLKVPVVAVPKSGEPLKVYFEQNGNRVKNVFLEGPAKFVYEGRLLS